MFSSEDYLKYSIGLKDGKVYAEQYHEVSLRQWFNLLADIFGSNRCTPDNQMELLHCLKAQGFIE